VRGGGWRRTGLGDVEADVIKVGALGLGEQQVGVGGARHLQQELRVVGACGVVLTSASRLAAPVTLHTGGGGSRVQHRPWSKAICSFSPSASPSFSSSSMMVMSSMCGLSSIRLASTPFHRDGAAFHDVAACTSINTCFHSLPGDRGSRMRASAPSVVKVIVNCAKEEDDDKMILEAGKRCEFVCSGLKRTKMKQASNARIERWWLRRRWKVEQK
jgi:hypothetical protein